MIRNKELVRRMSLKERIGLITSAKFGESRSPGNYVFPVLKISPNPAAETEGKFATLFPSDKALASSWNLSLVRNVYKCIGNEAKANAPYGCFQITNNRVYENVSEDYYFTGKFLASKARGLNLSGAHVSFLDAPGGENELHVRESVKLITDSVLTESEPDSLCLPAVAAAEEFPARYGAEGILFGVAYRKEEIAQYFFRGCTLVFLQEEFAEEAEDYLVALTEEYRRSKEEYDAGGISLTEFDRRMRSGEILAEETVTAACDRMVSLLLDLKGRGAASVSETLVAIDKSSHDALFNEIYHDKLAYRAAQQSAVLLKNRENILPLGAGAKIAVLGEAAKDASYAYAGNKNRATALKLPFDLFGEYELDAVGFANGYAAGEQGRTDLVETACKLCAETDCALVYLSAEAGEKTLPAGQRELIDALSARGVKIVAIVSANGVLDCGFADLCEAVLYIARGGQGAARAVLDLLTGVISPSGKLTESFPMDVAGGGVRYPFGYGLSYTSFDYKNLKITENGVSCTVFNTGGCDGFVTVQLYVQKEGSDTTLGYTLLRGFSKVFVRRNDAVKVEIPFDGNTFRTYDFAKGNYRVEGGDYRIYLADDVAMVRLQGELKLAKHVYRDEVYRQETVRTDGLVGFTDSPAEIKIRREKKKLSFGVKLFLALVLTLYYDAVGIGLMFGNFFGEKNPILYLVLGALLLIGNVLAVVYIVVIAKRRKFGKYLHPVEVLSDLVDKTQSFGEIARVVYEKPVPVEDAEFAGETEEEEPQEAAESEEPRVKKYEDGFDSLADSARGPDYGSFGEMCANFRDYAEERGVAAEVSSVRALFAALAAGRIVILSCKNGEALPDLLSVLRGYFGIPDVSAASDEWRSSDDLLWKKGENANEYVPSDFARAVNAAGKTSDRHCVLMLENVNFKNLGRYFSEFIAYALAPTEPHTLAVSEDLRVALPDNISYLLVPSAEDFEGTVPPELARAAIFVDFAAARTEGKEEATQPKGMSRAALTALVRDAREERFLPERVWRRIDELSEAIGATERFSVDNKTLLQLETFTSVLLESGGDENETLSRSFTAKIVPLLKTLKLYRGEDGGKKVYGYIEKIFGEEDLSAIQRSLVTGA